MARTKPTPAIAGPIPSDWDGVSNLSEPIVAPEQHTRGATAKALKQERVTIVLEDSESIPPTGQFLSADGIGYMLQPGIEASVPQSLINVLDTAIMSVPVKDHSDTVIGYKDRLRFPYRVVTGRRVA